MRRRFELMQVEIGMSTNRYFPARGTAGFDRSRVSGKSRLPCPPPITTDSTLPVLGDIRLLCIIRESILERGNGFSISCPPHAGQAATDRSGGVMEGWSDGVMECWEASPGPILQHSIPDFWPMCGIIGYVGKRQAAPILLEGLRRLEYRGYDSAGLTVLDEGQFRTFKKKGRIDEGLGRLLDAQPAQGPTGIG